MKEIMLFHGTSGAKSRDCPFSCAFLLIHLCSNVSECFYLCFGKQLRRFCAKELIKKIVFLMQQCSIESVPEISLPPCIVLDWPLSKEYNSLKIQLIDFIAKK
jgi:hypothetical protein